MILFLFEISYLQKKVGVKLGKILNKNKTWKKIGFIC